jgi:hypothetical protein
MMAALYAQQQGDIGSIRRVRWDMQQPKRRSDPAISGEAFRPSSGEYRLEVVDAGRMFDSPAPEDPGLRARTGHADLRASPARHASQRNPPPTPPLRSSCSAAPRSAVKKLAPWRGQHGTPIRLSAAFPPYQDLVEQDGCRPSDKSRLSPNAFFSAYPC